MTDDGLDALYDATIVRRAREARGLRVPENAAYRAKISNPLCGDRVEVGLVMADARVLELGFRARGCALSLASAHLLRELVADLGLSEARELIGAFRAALEADRETPAAPEGPAQGELAAALAPLLPVRRFPSRVRCATLVCEAALEALAGRPASPTPPSLDGA
ncbi:MAG: iron-sulfur cluster assembly scaffold protein [Myxococcota bacterium]